mgnify:CR=1 FL=1
MPLTYAARILSGWEKEHEALTFGARNHGFRLGGTEGQVTFSAGMTVAIAAITAQSCIVNGTLLAAVGSTTQVMAAADGTNPRRDVVWVDTAGVIGTTTGTAAASPVLPDIGSVSGGSTVTRLALAEVYVAAGATVLSASVIIDKRPLTGRSVAVDLMVHAITGTATLATSQGDHAAANIGTAAADGGAVFSAWRVPVGFARITTAVVTGFPGQTGDLRYDVAVDSGATGEARTLNSDSIAATTQAVVANQVIDISVTGALDGIAIAAGDEVGLVFNRLGSIAADTITDFYVTGLHILYWMTGN